MAKIKKNVPGAYLKAVVGSWLASHYVYEEGVMSNEFNFFKFMQSPRVLQVRVMIFVEF